MFWSGFADEVPSRELASAPRTGSEQPEANDAAEEARAVFTKLLPWTASLLLHTIIVILAVFIPWFVQFQPGVDEFIVPEAHLSTTPLVPLQMRSTTARRDAKSAWRSLPTTRSSAASPADARVESQSKLIGVLGATSSVRSPFGMGIGKGEQFSVGFFGSRGNATSIVYVVDASGSLVDTLDFVITELKRSIHSLVEQQNFTVFFYQGDRVMEVPPKGMKRANRKNKQHVIEWLDPDAGNIRPEYGSNPVKAIAQALRYRPQLLFLLSDEITGHDKYEIDQRRLIKSIKLANKHHTKINTIQFIYPDPLEKIGMKPTMQLIATTNGGIYKFLDARELGLE